MKQLIVIFLLTLTQSIYSQVDTVKLNLDSVLKKQGLPPHLFMYELSRRSDFITQDSLQQAGLVFDTHIGETYYHSMPTTGWRADTTSGWSKRLHENPYREQYYRKKNKVFYKYEKGKRFSGYQIDSVETGWREEPKQIEFEGTYMNGLLHGQAKFYFIGIDKFGRQASFKPLKSGVVKRKGTFFKGEMVGEWTYYKFNGNLTAKRFYVKGRNDPQRITEFYENGKVRCDIKYLRNGLIEWGKFYYRNGLPYRTAKLVDYAKNNTSDFYYIFEVTAYKEDGKSYLKGKEMKSKEGTRKIGVWKSYDANGKLEYSYDHKTKKKSIKK